jgi:hypothetical protein
MKRRGLHLKEGVVMNNINVQLFSTFKTLLILFSIIHIQLYALFFKRPLNILKREGGEAALPMTLDGELVALNLQSRVFNCIF